MWWLKKSCLFENNVFYEGYSYYFIKSRSCISEKPNGFSQIGKLVAKLWQGPPSSTFWPHGTYDECSKCEVFGEGLRPLKTGQTQRRPKWPVWHHRTYNNY